MDYRDRAYTVLKTAEQALRTILTEAVSGQAYREVASLAGVADELSALVRQLSPDMPHPPGTRDDTAHEEPAVRRGMDLTGEVFKASPGAPNNTTVVRSFTSGTSRRDGYPRYMRDGDRLVKVAWSKRERRPYEHRARREVVQLLVDKIRTRYKHVGEERVFEAAHVMPLKMANGEEYPSYQSYLALGWLRHIGAVTKKGREGYILKRGAATPEQLEALWNALPSAE